jgi:hypothetical protein
VPNLVEHERHLVESIAQARQELPRIEDNLARHQSTEQQAQSDRKSAALQHNRHLAAKPGILETIFSFGCAVRDWRDQLKPLAEKLDATEARENALIEHGRKLCTARSETQQLLSAARRDLTLTRKMLTELRAQCARDEQRFGAAYPGDKWVGDARELHAPWLDAQLDTARSELFLAPLELHQDFLAAAAKTMLDGLRAAGDVVADKYPHGLEATKLRAAWQLFFLTVPMVSTTFASASPMFGDIGREAIGWLLVDEAGQASPQYAAGAPGASSPLEIPCSCRPATAVAQHGGKIGSEHVRVIRGFLRDLPCWIDADTRAHAEAQLAEFATQYRPEHLNKLADKLADCLNPDGDFDDEDRAQRRGLTLGKQDRDGMSPLRGWLTPTARATLEPVLAQLATPGMANPYAEKPVVDGTPSQDAIDRDTRSAAQRNHDRSHAALRAVLASGNLGQHNGLPASIVCPPPSKSWKRP